MRPDYRGGGIVNLMSTLRRVFGAPDIPYPTLQPVDLLERLRGRSVILLVVDGLGYHLIRDRGIAPCLEKQLACALTSVFPSTTASAITTYLTGLAPHQHALVGWHTYFHEIDQVFTPLPFIPREPGQDLSPEVTPETLFGHQPLFCQVDAPTHSVSPRAIADSPYNRYHCGPASIHPYATVTELFEKLTAICRHTIEPALIYAYYPEIDFLSHVHGSRSEQVDQNLRCFDAEFERFLSTIADTNTTVLVTADHGFVDPDPGQRLDLADYPDIERTLARPLCGEPRVAYCYVKAGQQERFESLVTDQLADKMALFPSEQLVHMDTSGWENHTRICTGVRVTSRY